MTLQRQFTKKSAFAQAATSDLSKHCADVSQWNALDMRVRSEASRLALCCCRLLHKHRRLLNMIRNGLLAMRCPTCRGDTYVRRA